MLEFLAEKEPNEQYSIKETDRDSLESSENAMFHSKIDHQTIVEELSKTGQQQADNLFTKVGTSTVKDDNSNQDLL